MMTFHFLNPPDLHSIDKTTTKMTLLMTINKCTNLQIVRVYCPQYGKRLHHIRGRKTYLNQGTTLYESRTCHINQGISMGKPNTPQNN